MFQVMAGRMQFKGTGDRNFSRNKLCTPVKRSEVLTAVLLKVKAAWDVMQCRWVRSSSRFEGVFFELLAIKEEEDTTIHQNVTNYSPNIALYPRNLLSSIKSLF